MLHSANLPKSCNDIRHVIHLQDSESNPVRDLHYDSGSTIEMLCRVRRPPAYHTRVVWEARYAHSPGRIAVLNQDVTRGGVKGSDSGPD